MRGNQCDYVHTYNSEDLKEVVANISSELEQAAAPQLSSSPTPAFSIAEFPSLSSAQKPQSLQKKKKKKKGIT